MPSYPSQLNPGAFVPTTNMWDVSALKEIDVTSPQFKELMIRLYQNINNIALILNIKDSGYYALQEFVNGQAFFPNPSLTSTTPQTPTFRQVYRMVINFGTMPNSATKSVAHNLTITNAFTFTRIYGCCSDVIGKSYVAIPNSDIYIDVDATNVNITTTSDYSSYMVTYVILEYLKQ